jgi:formate dehydrogenase maturation protein FdhE
LILPCKARCSPTFLSLTDAAPPPLAQSAAALAAQGEISWGEILFWRAGAHAPATPAEALIAWTFLQPYAEALSDAAERPPAQGAPALCPFCALSAQGTMRWAEVLEAFWRADAELTACETVISWTFLQPYAEVLADSGAQPAAQDAPPLCPFCSGKPQVGVLRQLGDGAKRSLVCSLCGREWDFRRIVCPACGEESVDKLPVYVAEELGHLRLEACDTCRHFITTIDLTKDGRAVPVVDELAAIPLSLWAAENRYTKWSPNLLGL